jgi:hypothetical protein
MKRAEPRPRTWLHTVVGALALVFFVGCLMVAGTAMWPGVASARTVARGIADSSFIATMTSDPATAQQEMSQVKNELGATYIRFFVSWADAEPGNPATTRYDPVSVYMAGVVAAVSQAQQDGLKVMITLDEVPRWASDSSHWKGGVYQPNDAMSTAHLADFQTFCHDLARQLEGKVYAYECWNEPNLYLSLYPQKTKQDKSFAAHLYVKMLRRFSAGIRAGAHSRATDATAPFVVAGATAPRGSNSPDAYSTSPQRFAAVIKAAKVTSLFDAYSHHPYTPGASRRLWPEAAPTNPGTTVSLENLRALLKLFPTKPFFLTEYGYQTAACQSFTGQHVSQINQAGYLERAYAYAARYRQVKMLMWFLLRDFKPADPNQGFYTGLATASGTPKRAWYAFAGRNTLTLNSPASIKRGATLTLTGTLSCIPAGGGLAGQQLVVQRRLPGRPWSTLKTVSSQAAGAYSVPAAGSYTVQLKPKASAFYRVAWLGVVTSRTRHVAVS